MNNPQLLDYLEAAAGIDAAGYQAQTFAHESPQPWIDIVASEEDVLIGPGRWLTRGSGCMLVAPTGSGKSTWCASQAFAWGLGRESLGFIPARPLKSLVIQSEDDTGDLQRMCQGILAVLDPSANERQQIRENVLLVTEQAATGAYFLETFLPPLIEQVRPDLLWINPLSAFFGSDLKDQKESAGFFRQGLNPLMTKFRFTTFCIHHIPKPTKERSEWSGSTLAYAGSGSADIPNWSRETLVLREVKPGLFEMVATKRWRHLGWRTADGLPTQVRHIAHGRNGDQVWRDADSGTLEEFGAVPYSDSKLLELVPTDGIDKAELERRAAELFTVTPRTARFYIGGCLRESLRLIDGKRVRRAWLKEDRKPRREVYPDKPSGREVVWITRLEK
jgi:hypothetical protein